MKLQQLPPFEETAGVRQALARAMNDRDPYVMLIAVDTGDGWDMHLRRPAIGEHDTVYAHRIPRIGKVLGKRRAIVSTGEAELILDCEKMRSYQAAVTARTKSFELIAEMQARARAPAPQAGDV